MNSIDILKNIKYEKVYNELNLNINKIVIDTRKCRENSCYIGIKGEKQDGNKLYLEAFEKGADLVILDNYEITEKNEKYLIDNNKMIIKVQDSISALGELAKYKRSLFKNPVVAITGSAGKTSTKDMVYSVLKEKMHAHKTIGNQNNHIGLPLTILDLKPENEVLVLEMGMNHLKEISYLTNIAKPDVAIITNVGTAHIGNLGSRENILKAKLEILEGLNKNGTIIINNDNDLLHEWYIKNKGLHKIITIGINNESDFLAKDIILEDNKGKFTCNNLNYEVPVGGEHFIYNALVAIATATIFDINYDLVKKGIQNFELSSNRMSIIKKEKDTTIIDDSYNANYDSMKYAVKYLGSLSGRNIAVLGTMKELGNYSKELHKKIGLTVKNEDIDILITVGDDAYYINESAEENGFIKSNSYHFNNNQEAINLLNKLIKSKDNILIKASNSLNFKEIVDAIK